MEENVTEETDVERMAKGERTKTLDILSCILLFLTIFPLGSGFLLPYIFQTKNDNVRIPDYIWLSSSHLVLSGSVIQLQMFFALHYIPMILAAGQWN